MRIRPTLPAVLLLAPALAAGEPSALEAVRVTAEQPALESPAPALSSEVDAEQLEVINAPNVEDAIKYQPNLVVRKRYIGDRNATLSFRDMHTTQTARALVLGDGLTLSNFLGSSWDTAPRWGVMQPEEIDYVEVLYGPYAAEYAGNSLGGVVVMHGRMPEALEAHVSASAFAQNFSDYGTDETYPGYKLHASIGDRRGRWAYFVAADRLENEGQPMEFSLTPTTGGAASGNPVTGAFRTSDGRYLYGSSGPAELSQDLLKFKLGYDLTEDLQARVTVAYLQRREDTLNPESYLRDAAGNTVRGNPRDDERFDIGNESFVITSPLLSEERAEDLVLGGELEGALGGGWEIESAVSIYEVLEQTRRRSSNHYDDARANGGGSLTEDQGSGWRTFDLKLGHRHDGGWLGQRLLFGYHFDRYTLDRATFSVTSGWRNAPGDTLTGDSEGSTRVHALFVENEWRLAEPWTLTLGARQEWWRAYDGSLTKDVAGAPVTGEYPGRSESELSPKASLSYEPNRDWLAVLSLGIAYRFPTVGELYQGSIDNSGTFNEAFDPNLKTERGFAKNLRLTRYFARTTLTANLWENDVDDAIFSQPLLSGVNSYQNIDRVRSRGLELIGQWRDLLIDGLTVDANLSYTDAEILANAGVPDSVGKQFPRVPEWRANLFLNYRASERLSVGGGARYASDPYDRLDNSDGNLKGYGFTDGYLVLDVRASYRLGDGLQAAIGIDNLTDETYYVFHPYPGRTLFAEIKWQH